MAKLIVGLGNPGLEYKFTRHNIGFSLVDQLAPSLWKEKFKGEYTIKNISDEQYVFLKPMTFMNLSGESVLLAAKFYKVKIEDILVIHDELDLPFGTIALKDGGGLAGHNGLKSISSLLGGPNFKRLRMGIGRPVHGTVSSYVLSKFSSDEEISLQRILDDSVNIVEDYIEKDFKKTATSTYSKRKLIEG